MELRQLAEAAYRQHFYQQEHQNYFTEEPDTGPCVLSIKQEKDGRSFRLGKGEVGGEEQFRSRGEGRGSKYVSNSELSEWSRVRSVLQYCVHTEACREAS